MKKPAAARRKLVDWVGPRKEDGALRAMVGTTYEFQQDFFETDFLPNVLDLGAWKERYWTSRIALERRLSDLKVAAVFIDAACYRGRPDSLRVSVNPVALGRGRSLHAKVLLLVYEDAIRMLLGSANLTEKGYRKNREGVVALRCSPEATAQALLIQQGIEGLRRLVATWPGCGATALLDEADARLARWVGKTPQTPLQTDQLLWSDRDRPLWRSFVDAWPRGQAIRRISILSPFWSDDASASPLAMLLAALRERAEIATNAEIHLLTEAFPVSRDAFVPVLPEGFATFDARTLGVNAFVSPVDPRVDPQEVDVEDFDGRRDLHAKAVLVEGDTDALAYVGSANFTRRGWGLRSSGTAENANTEAGLLLRRPASEGFRKQVLPDTVGRPIPLDGAAFGKFRSPEMSATQQVWPAFITEVTLVPRADDTRELELHVTCAAAEITETWSLQVPANSTSSFAPVCSSSQVAPGSTLSVPLQPSVLERILLEREVEVVWGSPLRTARFPVNVDPSARDALPVAPGNLRPGESMLLAYYQGKVAWEELYPEPEAMRDIDAPAAVESQMVDTTRIQSYQIREFVEALRGIRDDLKAAAQSGSAMGLALRGPVSPVALAKVVDEAARTRGRTPVGASFQLVEILAILRDAASFALPKYQDDWLALLAPARQEVEQLLARLKADHPSPFGTKGAFARYERAINRARQAGNEDGT